jgi:hypothetical protein
MKVNHVVRDMRIRLQLLVLRLEELEIQEGGGKIGVLPEPLYINLENLFRDIRFNQQNKRW